MSIGLICFILADAKVRPNFNLYGSESHVVVRHSRAMPLLFTYSGVMIICLALVADAIIGNYQEKIMRIHHVPNVEMVFYSFSFGFLFVLSGLLMTNNLFSSVAFWNQVRYDCERDLGCDQMTSLALASASHLRVRQSFRRARLSGH